MNLQEILNFCTRSIEEQGVPSINSNGTCLYRGYRGAKCPVGHLIQDDEYEHHFEGLNISSILADSHKSFKNFDKNDCLIVDLLLRLQAAHDLASRRKDFLQHFHYRINLIVLDAEGGLTNPYENGTITTYTNHLQG